MAQGQTGPDALQAILQGTARETGEGFFTALVENLTRSIGTDGAWVTEYLPGARRLRALAFRLDDAWVGHYERAIDGTPCQVAIDGRRLVHYPDRVLELFPDEQDLRRVGAVSYMGVPLTDLDGSVLGHLAVIDRQPMPAKPREHHVCSRSSPAGRRPSCGACAPSAQVREREAELAGLVTSAMDAIVAARRPTCAWSA